MAAPNLIQRINHRLQEVVVGGQDGPVEPEFDDRLRAFERSDLAAQLLQFFVVRGVLRPRWVGAA